MRAFFFPICRPQQQLDLSYNLLESIPDGLAGTRHDSIVCKGGYAEATSDNVSFGLQFEHPFDYPISNVCMEPIAGELPFFSL